jgi:hypothetical protein
MLREIDSRKIEGNGGTVYLELADDGSLKVAIHDQDNTPVAVFGKLDGPRALEYFRHPFAHEHVPVPAGWVKHFQPFATKYPDGACQSCGSDARDITPMGFCRRCGKEHE